MDWLLVILAAVGIGYVGGLVVRAVDGLRRERAQSRLNRIGWPPPMQDASEKPRYRAIQREDGRWDVRLDS